MLCRRFIYKIGKLCGFFYMKFKSRLICVDGSQNNGFLEWVQGLLIGKGYLGCWNFLCFYLNGGYIGLYVCEKICIYRYIYRYVYRFIFIYSILYGILWYVNILDMYRCLFMYWVLCLRFINLIFCYIYVYVFLSFFLDLLYQIFLVLCMGSCSLYFCWCWCILKFNN